MDHVHIMLIGEHVEHVYTAVGDEAFHPIKRIYLIHSPNSKTGKKISYEKLAKDVKKHVERASTTKVHLIPLSEKGAFDKDETIMAITKIVKKEHPLKLVTQQQIAINITGGTNMMAVGAILAAASNKTQAYYVLDNRFPENENLDTYLRPIGIPFKIKEDQTQKALQKILYEIDNSSYTWEYDVIERPYRKSKTREDSTQYGWKIDSSIINSEWMTSKTIESAILQKELFRKLSSTAKETLRRRIEILQEKGMIIRKEGVPELTNIKRSSSTPTQYFRINAKEKLIVITTQGKAELLDYTP